MIEKDLVMPLLCMLYMDHFLINLKKTTFLRIRVIIQS